MHHHEELGEERGLLFIQRLFTICVRHSNAKTAANNDRPCSSPQKQQRCNSSKDQSTAWKNKIMPEGQREHISGKSQNYVTIYRISVGYLSGNGLSCVQTCPRQTPGADLRPFQLLLSRFIGEKCENLATLRLREFFVVKM